MKKIVILVALLLLPVVVAQLDWSITDQRCGNGVLDKYELCEKGLDNQSRCDLLGKKLGIDNGCFDKHCTCVPRINPAYCGNSRRDLNELCDKGASEDMCPALGEIMGNVSLKCNPTTCGCDINETISADYSPTAVGQMINQSGEAAVCGDKKVTRDEDCDPPNTLCTTSTKEPGICTEKCKCVLPEEFGVEETPAEKPKEETITANVTENVTENATPENVTEENVTEAPAKAEKIGFFGSIWAWIASWFS